MALQEQRGFFDCPKRTQLCRLILVIIGHVRADSSVGQSASLTQMRSQVRALFRPYSFSSPSLLSICPIGIFIFLMNYFLLLSSGDWTLFIPVDLYLKQFYMKKMEYTSIPKIQMAVKIINAILILETLCPAYKYRILEKLTRGKNQFLKSV